MPLNIHWTIPVKIHWEKDNPLDNTTEQLYYIGNCHWHSIGKCHWKFTMISEVLISGVQYFVPIRVLVLERAVFSGMMSVFCLPRFRRSSHLLFLSLVDKYHNVHYEYFVYTKPHIKKCLFKETHTQHLRQLASSKHRQTTNDMISLSLSLSPYTYIYIYIYMYTHNINY